jgi:hypothetical protein
MGLVITRSLTWGVMFVPETIPFPPLFEKKSPSVRNGNDGEIEPFCQLQVKKKLWVFQTFFKPLKYALFSK